MGIKCTAFTIIAILLWGLRAMAAIGFSDDFNDNVFDTSKWYKVLPTGDSNVVEQNQRLELTARGYLVTQAQFVPSVGAALRVSGQYIFLNTDPNTFDFLDITTRTSAIPGGGPSEVTDGISFTIWGNGNLVMIDRANNVQIGPAHSFAAVANHPYGFIVNDDGL